MKLNHGKRFPATISTTSVKLAEVETNWKWIRGKVKNQQKMNEKEQTACKKLLITIYDVKAFLGNFHYGRIPE